jgi:hypothetical protein
MEDMVRSFATRSRGMEVFNLLYPILKDPEATRVVVDWSGVKAASPSFVDEFVGAVCGVIQKDDYHSDVAFTGGDPRINDLIHTVARRRGCRVKQSYNPRALRLGHTTLPGGATESHLVPV